MDSSVWACGKSTWHSSVCVGASCSSQRGNSIFAQQREARSFRCPASMLVTVIMLLSRPRQATQLTGEHTDTRNTPWVFIVVHPEAVWTAEPVEKDLKACSDQAATAAFVYITGGSKTFSSLEISRKLDKSAHVTTVYSEWLNTWCVYAHVMIRSLYFASM